VVLAADDLLDESLEQPAIRIAALQASAVNLER
jgi:hypothetical protein